MSNSPTRRQRLDQLFSVLSEEQRRQIREMAKHQARSKNDVFFDALMTRLNYVGLFLETGREPRLNALQEQFMTATYGIRAHIIKNISC